MLTENEQDTSHKLYDLHGTLAGNPVLVSSVLGITVKLGYEPQTIDLRVSSGSSWIRTPNHT